RADTGENVGEEWPGRTGTGRRPNLFVVERGEHWDVLESRYETQERGETRVHRRQVVQATGGEEGVIQSEHGRGGGVGNADVVSDDVGGLRLAPPGEARQVLEQVGLGPVAEPEDRVHVRLLAQGQPIVDLAVEV